MEKGGDPGDPARFQAIETWTNNERWKVFHAVDQNDHDESRRIIAETLKHGKKDGFL